MVRPPEVEDGGGRATEAGPEGAGVRKAPGLPVSRIAAVLGGDEHAKNIRWTCRTGPAVTGGSPPTPVERAIVLGGFLLAPLCTAWSIAAGAGIETVAAAWLGAGAWAFVSSLALALGRGFRRRDWSAFRRSERPGDTELIDWSTRTGAYAYMRIAEENERLMRDN